jgi:MFS transporter, DHA2 family, multidrug resistance protein
VPFAPSNLLISLESLGSNPTPSYSSLYRESTSQGRCFHFLCASQLDAVLTRKAPGARVRARILPTIDKEPIVDVRLFKNFNFASTNVMMFVVGIVLFSSTVLLPQFLQTLMGYTAEAAGMVLSAAAILLLCVLPIVGKLLARFQARHLLAFGWITLAFGMYFSCKRVDLLISFRAATWMRILQYLPVGFLFVPLTAAGYVGLPKEKSNAAAGLMNFMRNIGQSAGTSAVTTLIARRTQYHQSVLAEYTRSLRFDEAVAALANRLTHVGLSLHFAHQQALARMYSIVIVQAQAISYVEVYWLLAVASVLMFLLSFLLAKNQPGAAGDVPVH